MKRNIALLAFIFVFTVTFSFPVMPPWPGQASAAEVANRTVELTVTETEGVARTDWPVTTGIPIPQGDIASASHFRVLNPASAEIPSEVTAVSYWPDGSIRWVHVHFQATVGANQSVTYQLNYGTGVTRQNYSAQLSVTEDSEGIYVDTGPLQATIGKGDDFQLFKEVSLDSTTIVPDSNVSDLIIVDADENVFKASLGEPDSVEVERDGLLHTIVKTTGTYVREQTLSPQSRDFLFQNGYESGETGSWSFWERNEGDVTFSADTAVKFAGSQSLKAVNTGTGEYSFTYGTEYNVSEGQVYTLSAAIKSYGVNASSFVRAAGKDAGGNVVNWFVGRATAPQDGNKWTSVSDTFTIPAGIARIVIELVSLHGGTTWFDAVQLESGAPQVKGDLRYSIRHHFYDGQDFVRVEHTLYNEMSQPVDIAEMSVVNTFNFTSYTQDFAFGAESGSYTGTLGSTVHAYLYQDELDHYAYYETVSTPTLTDEGGESPGWADLSAGNNGAVAVAVRAFKEQYPKYMAAENNTLNVGLWPALSESAATVRPGVSKTHDIGYYFHTGSYSSANVEDFAVSFQQPLRAFASAEWYSGSDALGSITAYEENDEFAAYESLSALGWDQYVDTQIEFGMMHYGDYRIMGEDMYGNLEYDTAYNLAVAFARTGNADYFRAGEIGAGHFADVDLNRGHENLAHDGEQYPYVFIHSEDHNTDSFHAGHVWSGGLAVYYLLTGELRLREAAQVVADSVIDIKDALPYAFADFPRKAGWCLWSLLFTYYATNDAAYLDAAEELVDHVLNLQDADRGLWKSTPGGAYIEDTNGQLFMIHILLKSLVEYDRLTQGTARENPDVGDSIVRAVDWLMDEGYLGDVQSFFYMQAPGLNKNYGRDLDMLGIESIAYASRVSGNDNYLIFAKHIMDVAVDHLYASWQNVINNSGGIDGKYVSISTRGGPGAIREMKDLGIPLDHEDVSLTISAPRGIVGGHDADIEITVTLNNDSGATLTDGKLSLTSNYLFSISSGTDTFVSLADGHDFSTAFTVTVPGDSTMDDFLSGTHLSEFKFHAFASYDKGAEWGGKHGYVGLRNIEPHEVVVRPGYLIKSGGGASDINVSLYNNVSSAYSTNLFLLNEYMPSGWVVSPQKNGESFAGKGDSEEVFTVAPAVSAWSFSNSGFEDGLTDWSYDAGAVTVNTANSHTGAQSLRIDGSAGAKKAYQNFTVTDGKPVVVGAWFKAATSSADVMVYCQGCVWQWETIEPADGWVYISNEGLGDGAAHQTQLFVSSGIAYADTAWFGDKDALPGNYTAPLIEAGPQLFDNADFENGLTDWSQSNPAKIAVETSDAYSGTKSVVIDGSAGTEKIYQVFTVADGQKGHIGAWFKAVGSSADVMVYDEGGVWSWRTLFPSDGWVYISNEVEGDGAPHQAQLLVSSGVARVDAADFADIVAKHDVGMQLGPPYRFDFGTDTSAVADGYVRATGSTLYSADSGFGWLTSLAGQERDRGTQDSLRTDLLTVPASKTGTFRIDVSNGDYWVEIVAGDDYAGMTGMNVSANGSEIIEGASAAMGQYYSGGAMAAVTDGKLELEFASAVPYDHWKINAITIRKLQ